MELFHAQIQGHPVLGACPFLSWRTSRVSMGLERLGPFAAPRLAIEKHLGTQGPFCLRWRR